MTEAAFTPELDQSPHGNMFLTPFPPTFSFASSGPRLKSSPIHVHFKGFPKPDIGNGLINSHQWIQINGYKRQVMASFGTKKNMKKRLTSIS